MPQIHKSFSSLVDKFRGRHTHKFNVLILGLSNAGKTTLAARLCMEPEDTIKHIGPTIHLNERHLKLNRMKVCLRDLSGQKSMRQSWHTFYQGVHILIYVLDSSDALRLGEARCELCNVLLDDRVAHVPLLILANKQDSFGALPRSIIVELLGLNHLEGRPWKIYECSSLAGNGIDLAVEWICKQLKQMRPPSRFSKLLNPYFLFGPTCLLEGTKKS